MLRVLRVVAEADQPVSLLEISAEARLDKSTVHRLLGYLCNEDMLVRDSDSRRYIVGPGMQALGALCLQGSPLIVVARQHLESLREATGETVTLHVPYRDTRVCVDGVVGHHEICTVVRLGESLPLHSGVTGKVLVGFSSLEGPIDVPDEIRSSINKARHLGYYASVNDRMPGVAVLAAPILRRKSAVGAIAIGGPEGRWTMDKMHSFAPTLQAATAQIGAQIAPH